MKILLEWLKDLVDFDVSLRLLSEELTLAGVAVEHAGEAENKAGTLLELEITTNRPDLLSHYGVAREIAALYGKKVKPIKPAPAEVSEPAGGAAAVEIADPDLCYRYAGLVLRNLKVGPSPQWLVKRLEACGVQSINNVVDVSNYVLLELGHPTHAFDLDTLAEKKIIVRRARAGDILTTLDGVERKLKPSHLVIADARRPVALAGVMGGTETEISFQTKNVLLESAWFDPVSTRRMAFDLGMRTEASYRFERGMDLEAPVWAARRCAEMMLELAGGELLAGAIDVYPRPWESPALLLRQSEIERILGEPVPAQAIERILSALGFKGSRAGEDSWQVVVPSWRRDVSREVDVIEEIARHHGYAKFPARLPPWRQPVVRQPHDEAEAALRSSLEAQGYDEAITFSLVNPAEAEPFLLPDNSQIAILNSLSEEAAALRPTGLLSLVKILAYNVNRGQRAVCFYEMGHAYSLQKKKFSERRILTLAGTGLLREKSVEAPEQPFDLFALKGTIEAALELFQLPALEFRPGHTACLHPGQCAAVYAEGRPLGVFGQLHPGLAAQFKLRQDAFLAELDLEALYAAGLRPRRYQPLSRFPAVARDFSLLLTESVSFGAVRAAIENLKLPELLSVTAVDRFRGGQFPAGHYSLLVRVVFQSSEHTLTDDQIRSHSERILEALEKKLSATLRA